MKQTKRNSLQVVGTRYLVQCCGGNDANPTSSPPLPVQNHRICEQHCTARMPRELSGQWYSHPLPFRHWCKLLLVSRIQCHIRNNWWWYTYSLPCVIPSSDSEYMSIHGPGCHSPYKKTTCHKTLVKWQTIVKSTRCYKLNQYIRLWSMSMLKSAKQSA